MFYVADMMANGVWKLDGHRFKVTGFIQTGAGAHGLYPSRDSRYLYVTNRGEGSISVVRFRTAGRQEVADTRRRQPRHGRHISRRQGPMDVGTLQRRRLRHRHPQRAAAGKIAVGSQPHGLCVWPQPGRYWLGHTGILR